MELMLDCNRIYKMTKNKDIIEKLVYTIKDRKKASPEDSYVAKISKNGKEKIANKLGEEAFETVVAFLSEGDKELKEECADLVFHLLLLLEHSNVSWNQVLDELERRMGND